MSSSPTSIEQWLQGYAPPEGVYDEFMTAPGMARAHLTSFLQFINEMGKTEFGHRWERAQRIVHDNGFAYGGYLSTRDRPRPWQIDAIPLVISQEEWTGLSQALQQRAELLDLVLADLYGEQKLLRDGIIPPELVFADPGFLRPYHGQPTKRYLSFYSADLARSSDGSWWVLADRTEAPSGLGYALENRIIISRMLPEVFQQCHVQRLAPYFMAVKETLRNLAPQQQDNPRIVLLSHGPESPNYFEDSYLTRYLGYSLVEGGDLSVRNRRVMLKTLGGLIPIDVIWRRQNSRNCDPLELNGASRIGVAGLLQTARSEQVGIANPLGSGLVESPAYMAFMPELCQAILGEELKMPGIATWWCGNRESRDYVLANLEQLIVQPAFRNRGYDGPRRQELESLTKSELADRIRANPGEFVAQERMQRSSVPVWNSSSRYAYLALRTYVVGTNEGFEVMPGGLARTSSTIDPLERSIRRGEGSKDVWVLSDDPVEHQTLLDGPGQQIELRRSGAELPSRAADNLFWMGRQLERAEASARVLRGAALRMSGETRATSAQELPMLLRCLADQGQIEPGYAVEKIRPQLPPIDRTLAKSVFDKDQPGCLRSVLDVLFSLGSNERNRMSRDTWRIIHRIDEGFRPPERGHPDISYLSNLLDELIVELAAFSGIVRESMTRNQGYRFLELGRRLESSLQMIGFVKNCFIPMPPFHGPILETTLEVADSVMTYRSRYLASLQLGPVLDLLLTDESNPRSLAHQLHHLAEQVHQLPRERTQSGYSPEERLAMTLLHSVRMIDIQSLAEEHAGGNYKVLGGMVKDWETWLPKLSEAISHRYLVHAFSAYQLTDINPQ